MGGGRLYFLGRPISPVPTANGVSHDLDLIADLEAWGTGRQRLQLSPAVFDGDLVIVDLGDGEGLLRHCAAQGCDGDELCQAGRKNQKTFHFTISGLRSVHDLALLETILTTRPTRLDFLSNAALDFEPIIWRK